MIELAAPAKLTWSLEVLDRRPDGLHELRAEMVTLDFADRLVVDEAQDYLVIDGASDLDAGEANLVRRALSLVGRRAGVHLTKHIPHGGGLGGGSADAAAILRWAGGVTPAEALSLGSDVPFCVVGGRAVVEGVGERVTPLPFVERAVTLILPAFQVNTRACYEVFDDLVATGRRPGGRNHLEAAAVLVEPRLGEVLTWSRGSFGDATVAGSGSSLFLEGHLRPDVQDWRDASPAGPVRFLQTTTAP